MEYRRVLFRSRQVRPWGGSVTCSSQLAGRALIRERPLPGLQRHAHARSPSVSCPHDPGWPSAGCANGLEVARSRETPTVSGRSSPRQRQKACEHFRSEEHTSELQSLMRTSYAVVCLKKKKYEDHHEHDHEDHQRREEHTLASQSQTRKPSAGH